MHVTMDHRTITISQSKQTSMSRMFVFFYLVRTTAIQFEIFFHIQNFNKKCHMLIFHALGLLEN